MPNPAKAKVKGRYELLEKIGQGGMGRIYRAFDTEVRRDVALKTVGDLHGRASLELFYKEWRVLADMHHANLIEIYDIGEMEEDGVLKPFFVMPLLKGVTLDVLIREPGHLPVERLVEIISQVCRGLHAAHERGLVHRDLKPSNIFVMDHDSVKVIDFGVAHLVGGSAQTALRGTPCYMSPEQISNWACTPASDIFSLGVVCYEALTGVRPFNGASQEEIFRATLNHIPPPASDLNPMVSQAVSRVIHKAIAKQPNHRYSSAPELAETLRKAVRNEPIDHLDPVRIQPRIQRAERAFDQGNYQLASDILSDLEAAGHIDSAFIPLRRKLDLAIRLKTIRELLDRARNAFAAEEFGLAMQCVQHVLQLETTNEEATRLKASIREEESRREIEQWLANARACLDQHGYARSRQLLQNVLAVNQEHPEAMALLAEVDAREQVYRQARQRKEQLYQSAREAWQNCEFFTALIKLKEVLELETAAPDTASPESGVNYRSFQQQVQSDFDAVEKAYTKIRRLMESGDMRSASEVCESAMEKYPGHELFPFLRLDIQESQIREDFAEAARYVQQVSAQTDLRERLQVLDEAALAGPKPAGFDGWARPVREKLALIESLIAKARNHESLSHYHEALERWRMVARLCPEYPGVQAEIERVEALGDGEGADFAPVAGDGTPSWLAISDSDVAKVPPPAPQPIRVVAAPSRLRQNFEKSAERAVAAVRAAVHGIAASLSHPSATMFWTATCAMLILASAFAYHKLRQPKPVTRPAVQLVAVTLRSAEPGVTVRIDKGEVTAVAPVLRTNLRPGSDHYLDIAREGYAPLSLTLNVPAAPNYTFDIPALDPLPQMVRITSDFDRGKVWLDGSEAGALTDAEFSFDHIGPGKHELKLVAGTSQFSVKFELFRTGPPVVLEPPATTQVNAVLVASLGTKVRAYSSSGPRKLSVDRKEAGEISPAGLDLPPLEAGRHEFGIGEGRNQPKLYYLENGAAPSLLIALSSDRDVGTLVVEAGEDDFRVLLDDQEVKRPIHEGSMRIHNLGLKKFRVAVRKSGYYDEPEQIAEIAKGTERKVQFALRAIPQVTPLTVRGLPPGTTLIFDGAPLNVSADGSYSGSLPPGDHTLEARNAPRYRSRAVRRSFKSGEAVSLTAADFGLEKNPATITLNVTPSGSQVTYKCGSEGAAREWSEGAVITCPEGAFMVTGRKANFEDDAKTQQLVAGEKYAIALALNARNVPPPTVARKACSLADLRSAGGWRTEGNVLVHKSGLAEMPCSGTAGQMYFKAVVAKGILGTRRLQWWIDHGGANRMFQADRKAFYVGISPRKDISSSLDENVLEFRIDIGRNLIKHSIRTPAGWVDLDTTTNTAANYLNGKFAFQGEVKLMDFSFHEQ